mgnify:CR=1 FL=1
MTMIKIEENKYFKDLTTFRVGGKIKYFVEVKDVEETKEALVFAKKNNLIIFILGEGSDLLVSDNGFNGIVIKFVGDSYKIDGNIVTAQAGLSWDKLVDITVENDLQGLECLSGIPGTVGASPIQNIGAYGAEMSNTFEKLEALNLEKGKIEEFDKERCEFGYRESIFKTKEYWQKYLILSVSFKLNKGGKPTVNYDSLKGLVNKSSTISEIREAVIKTRNERLENPKEHGNAGSFFQNPIIDKNKKQELEDLYPDIKIFPFGENFKVFAGWLIEKAGWKGRVHKEAGVSPKHALILINRTNKATAMDIYELSQKIIDDVSNKFGVEMKREVQLINF